MTELRELLTGWRDRTWPHRLLADRPRTGPATVVAVAGAAARAGVTTVAALLATAYAEAGRGRVVVADAAAGIAPLGERVTLTDGGTLVAPGLESWSLLAPHLERTAAGLWAVTAGDALPPGPTAPPGPPGPTAPAGPPGPAGPAADDPEAALLTTQAALAALSRHFAVAVLDCGDQAGPQARFLLGVAHCRLLVATATVDGVLAAAAALDRLELARRPDAAARTLVALVETGGRGGVDAADARALLGARGGAVRRFPYDAGLAAGGPVGLAELADPLRRATVSAAAELLRRAA